MELSSLLRNKTGYSDKEAGGTRITDSISRLADLRGNSDVTTEALYCAAFFESLLEVINARYGFRVNTLRDGGVAAIVSKLKSDGIIDDQQYSVITVARRIRNRLAHRFLEFESMDEKRRNEMLASLRKAVDILVPIAG
jgi:hypothetical protein